MKKTSIDRRWLMWCRIIAVSIFFASALFIGLKGDSVSGQQMLQALKNPVELQSEKNVKRGGDVNYTLVIDYADNKIYNPATGRDDKVRLRSYNGALVGPTVRVLPGQLLRMKLDNKLPAGDPTCKPGQPINTPHCFNSTNLHTHGWHVSPNDDDVLREVEAQTAFDYEYYLPKDHPAGTFWYHSHRHGSTALQVSSGMAGTLIVDGRRPLKDKADNGIADIDTILKDADGNPFEDRIFMFEQIQYDCGKNGTIKWKCDPDDVGMIENYKGLISAISWRDSGRFTLTNGQLQPLVETQAGKIERWRLIHGGVRETINFRITRSKVEFKTRQQILDKLAELKTKAPDVQNQWLKDNCSLEAANGVRQAEFAVDGITRQKMSSKMINVLQPGYRSDVLVAFDKPGVYCVLDDASIPASNINNKLTAATSLLETAESLTLNLNDRRLLSMVVVSGGTQFGGEPQDYIAKQLVAANQDLPDYVKTDLAQLRVPEFVPHADIPEHPDNGRQELTFGGAFQVANKIDPPLSEYKSFDPDRTDRTLILGGTDEWKLKTKGIAPHPFHIHINPFQIIQILNKDGRPVVDENGKCNDGADPQYCDQIGVFRDTLLIKGDYTVVMRTRYERYPGTFVLHCHILDHEDRGMMQKIEIVANPAKGAKHSH